MGRRTKKQIEADKLAAEAEANGGEELAPAAPVVPPASTGATPVLPTTAVVVPFDTAKNTQGVVPSEMEQLVVKNGKAIVNAYIDHNMLVVNAETRTLYHLDTAQKPQTVCSVLDTLAGDVLIEMT